MFYLHTSNRTEKLLEHLTEVIRAGGRSTLFEKEIFLVQSQGMERMISQHLASSFQCWCNYDFLLPIGFMREIATCLKYDIAEEASFDRKFTLWQFESLLHEIDEEMYLCLRSYLTGNMKDIKRFQLARQLAQVFDEYQFMRPDLLDAWHKGNLKTVDKVEPWQAGLWRRLTEASGSRHRGTVFQELIELLKEYTGHDLPKRISVFGVHIMPPLFVEFFKVLATHSDVHLYLLSPCRHYWGDMESKRTRYYRLKKEWETTGSTADIADEEKAYNPLLMSFGRQGRDFQRMLVENVDFELEFDNYHDPIFEGDVTLLKRLQHDLLEANYNQFDPDNEEQLIDNSLRIVSCHSPFRELNVLKDHILQLLYDDEGLQLKDIVVMAPDIQKYSPLIPAVFDDIQHSIADRAVRRRNSVMSAFIAYLELFSGDFGWSEVLDLLRSEHIYPTFDLVGTDFEFLQKWVVEAGVRCEPNEVLNDTENLDVNSWQRGLERLLLGFAMSVEDFVDDTLPYQEIEGNSALALGGLCEFIEVIKNAKKSYLLSKTLNEWVTVLRGDIDKLFGDVEDLGFQELQQVISELQECSAFHQQKLSFRVIKAWFEQVSSESRSTSGFLRGQLTFCSMLPMRSIPFRVICLLGLDGGTFPKQDRHATFDLIGKYPRLGDRLPSIDDRYQFLEALISARDCFYLSFVGRSIRNNEASPPAVVVGELLEVLEYSYGVVRDDIVVEHPLHPFSLKYFQGEDEHFFSYSMHYGDIAKSYLEGKKKSKFSKATWWTGERDVAQEDNIEISLAHLIHFYKNPQQWFVRNCLGIDLRVSEVLPDETEAFVSEGLENYLITHRLVEDMLAGKSVEGYQEKYSASGSWPLGSPGDIKFDDVVEDLVPFVSKVQAINLGNDLGKQKFTVEIGKYRIACDIQRFEKGQVLYRNAKLKGKDLFEAWLTHLVCTASLQRELTTWFVASDKTVVYRGQPSIDKLLALVDHCVEGSMTLSNLHVEACYAYGLGTRSSRGKTPIQAAEDCIDGLLERGYEAELGLLCENGAQFISNGFEALYEELFAPLWEGCDESTS